MSLADRLFFFFNDTATTEISTLSLHAALPISGGTARVDERGRLPVHRHGLTVGVGVDRKSTRLNSSHSQISYAVFCLKKKNEDQRGILSDTSLPGLAVRMPPLPELRCPR